MNYQKIPFVLLKLLTVRIKHPMALIAYIFLVQNFLQNQKTNQLKPYSAIQTLKPLIPLRVSKSPHLIVHIYLYTSYPLSTICLSRLSHLLILESVHLFLILKFFLMNFGNCVSDTFSLYLDNILSYTDSIFPKCSITTRILGSSNLNRDLIIGWDVSNQLLSLWIL